MNKLRKSLGIIFPAMRISFALVLLTSCVLLAAEMLGFTPDEDRLQLEARKQISESLAIQFAVLDPKRDLKRLQRLVSLVAKRNPNILSTGIRPISGQLVYNSPNHEQLWQGFDGEEVDFVPRAGAVAAKRKTLGQCRIALQSPQKRFDSGVLPKRGYSS